MLKLDYAFRKIVQVKILSNYKSFKGSFFPPIIIRNNFNNDYTYFYHGKQQMSL